MSITVCFHKETSIADALLKFAVIAAKYNGKWIFCRHKNRNTYEIPGGHRESGEDIIDTAKRELYEETGALEFELLSVCIYSVSNGDETTYGALFAADVKRLGELPKEMEIGEIIFADTLPDKLTYPAIQPYLFEKVSDLI
jgi:8-oxo-dGTP diphosphatase